MEDTEKGAWIIHHTNKLQNVNNQSGFDAIFSAGKCGFLLSAISETGRSTIDKTRFETLAQASQINKLELSSLTTILEDHGLITVSGNKIHVLGVTNQSILKHVNNMYEYASPSKNENSALEVAEIASTEPIIKSDLIEFISDEHKLSSREALSIFSSCEQIGFTDFEDIDHNQRLYFNGNIFRRDSISKVKRVLDGLNSAEEAKLKELNEILDKVPCLEGVRACNILGENLYKKLAAIGLIDISVVSNENEETAYISRPSAYSKYGNALIDDTLDLAKSFVSSLTYGMTKSAYERGQIKMLTALMSALIRGEWVGPVEAIGQDYKLLELKGVIEVKVGAKKGRTGYLMRLLKKDIGELALEALRNADVSSQMLPTFRGANITNYSGPETERSKIRYRQKISGDDKQNNDMLMSLRTGGLSYGR